LVALPLLVHAADPKVNFTGDWTLDGARSDFGAMPKPDKVVQKVAHKEPLLEVESTQVDGGSERKLALSYRTDGTATKGKIGENDLTSTAAWEGSTLAIESKLQIPGGRTLTFKERWTLSEDGKLLTILRTVSTDLGDLQFKLALVRQ
jgi:hypothetical protein